MCDFLRGTVWKIGRRGIIGGEDFFLSKKGICNYSSLKVFSRKFAQCVWYSNLPTSSNDKMESNVEN